MKFFSMTRMELDKIRRSKIWMILVIPVIVMWIPSVINAGMNFDTRGIPITPEKNFFIQGFMGMVWFMIPASIVVCTVLLTQLERSNKGMVKMLSLPVSAAKLCLSKFTVLLLLTFFQMALSVAAYFICTAIASYIEGYSFWLDPFYVCRTALCIYGGTIPMSAVFWMIANLIHTPVFSVGIGLASIVPTVMVINTKIWFAYPMSYPFYLLMVEYGRAASGVYDTQIAWLPWLPVAAVITALALAIACARFGKRQG